MDIEPGMTFMAEGPNNEHAPIWVIAVEGDKVIVDSQHPLSGKTLHFEVEVMAIRPASPEELEHGHPHGPDGHGHHH
jgi:FKBP-type peptidyl-prolyl cis-trans isomerase SlyD